METSTPTSGFVDEKATLTKSIVTKLGTDGLLTKDAKFLCVGDIHLGRQPGHLPDSLVEYGLTPRELGPAEGWRRAVSQAIALRAEAVLLLGDVIDKDNRFYEALGPLEDGILALAASDIPVYAVTGNHDGDVLPRLAKEIPSLQLLGSGSAWEIRTLPCGVRLIGWSFSGTSCRENPMDTIEPSVLELSNATGPVIGLLHCDLDVPDSRYAPVRSRQFQNTTIDAWLFGHIHKPHPLAGSSHPIGYLGSLSPLDPTETGIHGPWVLQSSGSKIQMRQIALAPLRWEGRELSLEGLQDLDDFENLVTQSLLSLHEEIAESLGDARAVGCRLRLTGRTRCFHDLPERIASGDTNPIRRFSEIVYFVDRIDHSSVRPALDLERLAEGQDPPAILAGLLLAIEHQTEDGIALVRQALPTLQSQADHDMFTVAGRYIVKPAQATKLLLQSGFDALELLLAQKPPAPSNFPAKLMSDIAGEHAKELLEAPL